MRFYEFKTQKPLTPDQARIKALKDQAKRARDAIKAERARQKIRAAQATLSATESMNTSYRAQHKSNNAYSAWITIGTYGNFNSALNAVLQKKKQGSIAVQIVDSKMMVVYSA